MTKKQGYSTVVCFITVSIITIFLLLNGLIIHADENISMIDIYNIPSYMFKQDDFGNNFPAGGVQPNYSYDTVKTTYDIYYNKGFYFSDSLAANFEYPYYLVNSNIDSGGDVDITSIPDGSFLVYNGASYSDANRRSWYFVFVPVSTEQTYLNSILYYYDSRNDSVSASARTKSQYNGATSTIDGVEYYRFQWSDRYIIHMSNLPIYFKSGDILELESLEGLEDLNTDYGLGGGSGSMSEDIDKGLYMLKGSCVYLSNKSFNDGTLYVNALLTDDQKNNPNLTVAVKGSCTYSFGYSGVTASAPTIIYTQGYSNQNSKKRVFNILWGDDANTLVSHEKTVNCDFGMLGSYPISVDYNSDNSGTNAISLSEVNNNMFTGDLPSGVMFRANIGNMASSYDSANASNFTVRNFNLNLTKNISVNTGFLDQNTQSTDVYLTDVRYHFELYMVENYGSANADWSDIIYSYDVDMLRGTASVGTDGTLTYDDLDNNFDGDIPSQYLPSTDVDSSGGSSSASSGGNNQVVTINGDDSAKYLPSLINKLLPSDSDSNGGLSEDFQNIVNSNGWLSVIKYSFSFIPETFWDTMVTYFTAILGLLACAFLIRIILDLL